MYSGFIVGDRVMALGCIDGRDLSGMTGTIVDISDEDICIEFDEDIDGHDCDGLGKPGHCRWTVGDDRVEYICEDSDEDYQESPQLSKFLKSFT